MATATGSLPYPGTDGQRATLVSYMTKDEVFRKIGTAVTITAAALALMPFIAVTFVHAAEAGAAYTIAKALAQDALENKNVQGFYVYVHYEYITDYWTPDGACIDMWMPYDTDIVVKY